MKTAASPNKNPQSLTILEEGGESMRGLLDDHIEQLLAVRDRHAVRDVDLLTSKSWFRWLPDAVVEESVNSLHDRMKKLIVRVAEQVEEAGYLSAEVALREITIPMEERKRALALIGAERSIRISFTTLKVAVEIFARMNDWIVRRIELGHNLSGEEERRLVLANAILVYELTAFCLKTIEDFSLEGVAQIQEIHKRMMDNLSKVRRDDCRMRREAEKDGLDPGFAQRIKRDISNRAAAIKMVEQEWTSYLGEIGSLSAHAAIFRKKLPMLRLVRDNAKSQIAVLSAVSVIQLVRSNLSSLEDAITELERVEIVTLSPERMQRLLRVNGTHLTNPES